MRRSWLLIISLSIHGLLALVVAFLRPPTRDSLPRGPIEVSLLKRRLEAAPTGSTIAPRDPSAPRSGPRETPSVNPRLRPPRPAIAPRVAEVASSPGTQAPSASVDAVPRRIDLFPSQVLGTMAVPGQEVRPGLLGKTRRRGDGSAVPGEGGAAAEREEVAARIARIFDEHRGDEALRAGLVAAPWRTAERELQDSFRPAPDVVADTPRMKTWAKQAVKQWIDPPTYRGGDVPRGVDPSQMSVPGVPDNGMFPSLPLEQAFVAQNTPPKPLDPITVEIEVTVDARGEILRAEVTRPSHRRRFDEQALDAVRRAVTRGGPPEEKRSVLTRWRVSASVLVSGPTSFGCGFDEVTLKASCSYPLKRTVSTKVSLIAVRPL